MKEGDTIYLRTIAGSNAARRNDRGSVIKEEIITKVGKKFFEVGRLKFYVDSMIQYSNISADYKAYLNKELLENEIETERLYKLVSSVFRNYSIPENINLTMLQEISKILKIN
jgi:hypothetical protein